MDILKIVLTILMIIICVVLTVIVLLQEGKQNGLSSLSGQSMDTYWSKNKGRSKEGLMVKITSVLVLLFFVLSAVLNLSVF